MKQIVNSSGCTVELWLHLVGLPKTQEATVTVESTWLLPCATLTLLSCLSTSLVHLQSVHIIDSFREWFIQNAASLLAVRSVFFGICWSDS